MASHPDHKEVCAALQNGWEPGSYIGVLILNWTYQHNPVFYNQWLFDMAVKIHAANFLNLISFTLLFASCISRNLVVPRWVLLLLCFFFFLCYYFFKAKWEPVQLLLRREQSWLILVNKEDVTTVLILSEFYK